jgi:5-methylcytosine-specific restriction protein A
VGVRECIDNVLQGYSGEMKKPLSGNPMAAFIRTEFPNTLKGLSDDPDRYIFEGSAGKGQWTRSPWAAVFDILITESAQSGYYPVYLFREDFSGVYLSLNQGVTEIRGKYQSKAKDALRTRAADFRAQLGGLAAGFPSVEIDLRPSSASNLSSFYEAGNICAKFYDREDLSPEVQLAADFRDMLRCYETLSYNETVPIGTTSVEEDEEEHVEDLRKLKQHKRVERNSRLARAAKRVHGYHCQVCGFNFEKVYGEIGKEFIEAHHLIPIAQLKGKKLKLDPRSDFAVLCSNCHRMIHRFPYPDDLSAFKRTHLKN